MVVELSDTKTCPARIALLFLSITTLHFSNVMIFFLFYCKTEGEKKGKKTIKTLRQWLKGIIQITKSKHDKLLGDSSLNQTHFCLSNFIRLNCLHLKALTITWYVFLKFKMCREKKNRNQQSHDMSFSSSKCVEKKNRNQQSHDMSFSSSKCVEKKNPEINR